MSPILASFLVLLLYAVILVPAAIAFFRLRGLWAVVPFYAFLTLGIFLHYGGLPGGGGHATLAVSSPTRAAGTGAMSGPCAQAVDQSEEVGLILERSDPARVTVRGTFWSQLPQQVKEALIACLNEARPVETRDVPLEIVEADS